MITVNNPKDLTLLVLKYSNLKWYNSWDQMTTESLNLIEKWLDRNR